MSRLGDEDSSSCAEIDVSRSRFPYCIVWTPLPIITWFLPPIGHMGIADSSGVIFDFAGPYAVTVDHMAFGKPTRYLRLDPGEVSPDEWDEAVARASEIYNGRMHNLLCDNCHSHVATALDLMRLKGFTRWNMVILCFWVFVRGTYISVGGFLKQWLAFFIGLSIYLIWFR